ncbi:MAG: tRNA (adenosine(37)-N6)-threonylcarbamoyltransferase complex dimerization subunit type 1 TsaB [Pseudomonadota bacterium]
MRILSIDTTSMLGSVALSEDERLVAQEQQGVPGTHSERLMVSIDHLLSLAQWQRGELDAVAVAIGPGSFTGLRIGLGTAKGIALALGVPVAGVSSLASLALNGRGFAGTVVPLIDARRGEIYAAAIKVPQRGRTVFVLRECVLPPLDLIKALKRIKGNLLLVGDGAIEYGARILKAVGARAEIAAGTSSLPQAVNLALLSLPRFERGKGDDIASLVPNYIRHSDAEIGFRGK